MLKVICIVTIIFSLNFITPHLALAQTAKRGTKQQAVALVKRVKKMWHTIGPARTIKAVNKLSHNLRRHDLYPFILHTDGYIVAHYYEALRGLMEPDNVEYPINWKLIRALKGKESVWASYFFVNPVTKQLEKKLAYLEDLGDGYSVAVGVYARLTREEIKEADGAL